MQLTEAAINWDDVHRRLLSTPLGHGDRYSVDRFENLLVQDILEELSLATELERNRINAENHSSAMVAWLVQGMFGGKGEMVDYLPYADKDNSGSSLFSKEEAQAIQRVFEGQHLSKFVASGLADLAGKAMKMLV